MLLFGLSACTALQPPARPVVYDFGPGALANGASSRVDNRSAMALADVQASAALDSTAVLYRLAYSDAQQLRPYGQARWSMPPAQLVRQRLREQLGQQRPVLDATQGVVVAAPILSLHVDLDEFSQLFSAADQSSGLVRLRATVGQSGPAGERLVAQRSFVVQRPAATADAAGGVRALSVAADAAIAEIEQWLQQLETTGVAPR